jgi:hypothetical protein
VVGVGEQRGEAFALPVGEQVGAGVQGPPGPVQRVALRRGGRGGLLDPAPAPVQGVPGQADDVEGVHHRTASGSSSAAAVLKPVNPSIATTSTASRHCLGPVGEPGLERGLGAAFDHVQQPGGAGAVADRGQVDDHGDVLVALAGVPPHVLIDADHRDAVEPGRVAIRTRCPSARTASLAVSHATAKRLGDPGDGQVLLSLDPPMGLWLSA